MIDNDTVATTARQLRLILDAIERGDLDASATVRARLEGAAEDVGGTRGPSLPWAPGIRHGYHAVTLGWYESELIRHADPLGAHWASSSLTRLPNHSGWSSTSDCRPRWTATGSAESG